MNIKTKLSARLKGMLTGLAMAGAFTAVAQKRDKTDQMPEIKRVQAEWHRAYVVSDSVKLQQLLGPQARVTRTTGVVLKRPQILNHYRTRDVSDLTIATVEQEVRTDGSLAVVTARVNERDKGIPYPYHVTDVLERRGPAWQVVHSQWAPIPGQWEKLPLDSAQLSSYTGTYESATGRSFTISAQQGQVTLLSAKGRRFVFVPRSATQFFIPGEPEELLFIKGSGDAAPPFAVLGSGPNSTVYERKK
jgi:hypothetical protein